MTLILSFGEKNYSIIIDINPKELFDCLAILSERIISFLVYNSLFISLVCVFLTYSSFQFLNITPNNTLLIAVFLSTFSVYSLNRLTDLEEDSVNVPEREAFVRGKEKILLFLCIVSYAVAILLGALVNPLTIIVLLFPLVIGVLYSIEVSHKVPRLKNIPGMKNFIVALSWTVGAVFIPFSCQFPGISNTLLIFFFFFAKLMVNAISFDVRDIEGDKKSGVKTIPVLLGRSKTKILLYAIQSTLIIWLLLIVLTGLFIPYWLVFSVFIIYGYVYIHVFSKKQNFKTFSRDLLVDGEWLFVAMLCFLFSLIF
jgi:4-hydroxybenzoate polyprenyltransferase